MPHIDMHADALPLVCCIHSPSVCVCVCVCVQVAVWGGFVFVLNLVGMHAGALAVLGRYSSKLHRAYSLFYVIGTLGAIQVCVYHVCVNVP